MENLCQMSLNSFSDAEDKTEGRKTHKQAGTEGLVKHLHVNGLKTWDFHLSI